jgi:hypothetical protein
MTPIRDIQFVQSIIKFQKKKLYVCTANQEHAEQFRQPATTSLYYAPKETGYHREQCNHSNHTLIHTIQRTFSNTELRHRAHWNL